MRRPAAQFFVTWPARPDQAGPGRKPGSESPAPVRAEAAAFGGGAVRLQLAAAARSLPGLGWGL